MKHRGIRETCPRITFHSIRATVLNTPETQLAEIKLIYEYINDPDGVVFCNVIFQAFRE
jgi:hypothetical protein